MSDEVKTEASMLLKSLRAQHPSDTAEQLKQRARAVVANRDFRFAVYEPPPGTDPENCVVLDGLPSALYERADAYRAAVLREIEAS